jgi:hypothetical protein
MQDHLWQALPYPFVLTAEPHALPRLDTPCIFAPLLEGAVGAAGTLAAATWSAEVDQDDIRYAARLLAEHLKSAVVLWRTWQEEDRGGGVSGPPVGRGAPPKRGAPKDAQCPVTLRRG